MLISRLDRAPEVDFIGAKEQKTSARGEISDAVACVVIKSCFCLPLRRSVGRSVGPRGGKVMHHRGCMVWLVPNYEDTGSPVTPYSVGANLGVIKDK